MAPSSSGTKASRPSPKPNLKYIPISTSRHPSASLEHLDVNPWSCQGNLQTSCIQWFPEQGEHFTWPVLVSKLKVRRFSPLFSSHWKQEKTSSDKIGYPEIGSGMEAHGTRSQLKRSNGSFCSRVAAVGM
jgi:hypothetical protein